MKTTNFFFGLVLVALVIVLGGTGCATKMNTITKITSPRVVPGTTNVVYETFSHTDRSVIRHRGVGGGGGGIFRFRAEAGGMPTFVPAGGYAPYANSIHPVVTVPLESQGAFQAQTWNRYTGGGGYSPPSYGGGGGRYGY